MRRTVRSLVWLALPALLAVGCGSREETGPLADPNTVELIRTSLSSGAPAVDTEVAAAEPTGFATLKGTFRFDGQAPNSPALSITKDEAICAPGGKTVFDRDFVAWRPLRLNSDSSSRTTPYE